MKVFHQVCPICKKPSKGFCTTCLFLIHHELKSSYMYGLCNRCARHLISSSSVCLCKTKQFHYILFDNTIIIKTLIENLKHLKATHCVTQIGDIILQELSSIDKKNSFNLYHDEHDTPHSSFFDLLISYIHTQRLLKGTTPLCLSLKEGNQFFNISLISDV